MDAPSSQTMRRLARRIATIERDSNQVGASKGTTFIVCEKLRASLSPLVGVAGFRSLLSRALALAAVDVDWLKKLTIMPDGSLRSLEAAAGLPDEEIARGEMVLIAHLVGLLITFIGEALTLRLLQEAWPEVSRSDLSSGPETNA